MAQLWSCVHVRISRGCRTGFLVRLEEFQTWSASASADQERGNRWQGLAILARVPGLYSKIARIPQYGSRSHHYIDRCNPIELSLQALRALRVVQVLGHYMTIGFTSFELQAAQGLNPHPRLFLARSNTSSSVVSFIFHGVSRHAGSA